MTAPQGNETFDDRGHPCALHVLNLPRRPAKHLRKLRNTASLHNSKNMYWTEIYGFVLTAFVPFGLFAVMQNLGPSTAGGVWTQGLLIGMVSLALVMFWNWIPIVATSRKRETARRAIAAWSEFGLCPACGHDIALDLESGTLTPSEDGHATCLECRAQWKTARFDVSIEAHRADWRREWEESPHPRQPDTET